MGFKEAVINNIAGQIFEAIDKQVNGAEIVNKIQADLQTKNVPASTIKKLSEGPIFNITCEMQEGLWDNKEALATEYERRAKILRGGATSAGKAK